jgi:glycosyltransferase involved in cell wall biosynthesis
MEMHAKYFIDYFKNHLNFPISGIVTKDTEGKDYLILKEKSYSISIKNLVDLTNPTIVFFNSGRWIEELSEIKKIFSRAKFIYRTGGNEILKASLIHNKIPDHSLRQSYWVQALNDSIDLLITNSDYTEKRLNKLGITCLFERCVGGVNTSTLSMVDNNWNLDKKFLTIFCAARFVPYKNHSLMLSITQKLASKGYNLKFKLAGEGPLLEQIRRQVIEEDLSSIVEFLGVLDNSEICNEIAKADIYMQLSGDRITKVQGGSYIHSEGMGRSILEALTVGTFIIAGNSGALPEIIPPDRGLLINLDDLEKITDQIEQIIRNPPAKLPLLNKYGWNVIFEHYEELFESIIK